MGSPSRNYVVLWTLLFVLIVFGIGVLMLMPVPITQAPAAVVNSLTALNPKNFEDAQSEFFRELDNNRITIISQSASVNSSATAGPLSVGIKRDRRQFWRLADQKNQRSHANIAVLTYACYEFLYRQPSTGLKLLILLDQHAPETYNSRPGKEIAPGKYDSINISVAEILAAAQKVADGKDHDQSARRMLELIARQFPWRVSQYAPPEMIKAKGWPTITPITERPGVPPLKLQKLPDFDDSDSDLPQPNNSNVKSEMNP
jgi:hypothetical protein